MRASVDPGARVTPFGTGYTIAKDAIQERPVQTLRHSLAFGLFDERIYERMIQPDTRDPLLKRIKVKGVSSTSRTTASS